MSRLVTVRDWIELEKPTLKKDALQFFADASKTGGKFLIVVSDASFSGYLLNGRTYPGIHMRDGIPTWTDQDHGGVSPFCAPVLLHHDDKKDPIGRVAKAEYTQLWSQKDWYDDWKKPASGLEKGSGVTRLWMAIADKDAQEKFLDGRYKTFSTNFRTTLIKCSICSSDLSKDSCDHQLGQEYEAPDGDIRKCYLVTGPQFNKETSVVNHPAQPWAVAQDLKWTDEVRAALTDSQVSDEEMLSKWELHSPLLQPHGLQLAIADAEGHVTLLTLKDGEQDAIPQRGKGGVELPKQIVVPHLDSSLDQGKSGSEDDAKALDEHDLALANIVSGLVKRGVLANDSEMSDVCVVRGASIAYISGLTAEADGHQHSVYLTIDLAAKLIRGWTESTFPSKKNAEVVSHTHPVNFDVDDLNSDVFSGDTRDASSGANHTHKVEVAITRDALLVPTFEECLDLSARFDRDFSDSAKLTPVQRKIRNSSAYCGPGQTFPVSDCAHVDAARRLVPRFKGSPAQKMEILDAIGKRAKTLACADRDAGNPNGDEQEPMSQPTPSASGKPGTPATPDTQTDKDKTIASMTDSLEAEKTRAKGYQSDLDSTKTELTASQKKLTELADELHQERCGKLALLRALSGRKVSGHNLETESGLKAYSDALRERPDVSIKDAITDEMSLVVDRLPSMKGLGSFIKDSQEAARGGDAPDIKRNAEPVPAKPAAPKKTGKDALLS